MSGLLVAGAFWMIVHPSSEAFAFGGLLGVAAVLVLWRAVAIKGANEGLGDEVAVTREGLRSSLWSLDWDGVTSIRIERHRRVQTMYIQARSASDVRVASQSIPLRIEALINRITRRAIVVVWLTAEESKDDLLAALSTAAGRSFR